MHRLAERPRRYKCLFYQWCGPETGSSSSATGWGVRDGANHLPYRVLGGIASIRLVPRTTAKESTETVISASMQMGTKPVVIERGTVRRSWAIGQPQERGGDSNTFRTSGIPPSFREIRLCPPRELRPCLRA